MSEQRKIIAVDFDGCISMGKWPELGSPNKYIIGALIKEKERGSKLILWTCREGEYLQQAVDYCRELGLEFDAVNDNLPERTENYGCNSRKVVADEYWDDLAIRMGVGYSPQEVVAVNDVESLIGGVTGLIERYRTQGALNIGLSATHLREILRRLTAKSFEAVKVAEFSPLQYLINTSDETEEENGEN